MGILGDGATLEVDSGAIGEITNIKFGGGGYDAVDVSHLGSTGLRTFLQTLTKDGGELNIAYHAVASAEPAAGEHEITITLADDTEITFSAFTLTEDTDIPYKDKVSHNLRMKITATDESGS